MEIYINRANQKHLKNGLRFINNLKINGIIEIKLSKGSNENDLEVMTIKALTK